jgi:endo-1,4-beta-D-glucanase Y
MKIKSFQLKLFQLLLGVVFLGASCSDNDESFEENTEETCKNNLDDDADGILDCDEASCASFCGENSDMTCTDGVDNDGDEFVDCDDVECLAFASCADRVADFQPVRHQNGIQPALVNHAAIRKYYNNWLESFYEESPDGTMARVKRDKEEYSVSEGIAYGMLIVLAMEDTPDKLKKLYAYYKKFMNQRGVMNWCIMEFDAVAEPCDHNGSNGYNGATDAELDAVTALLQGYKKYNDPELLTDAQALADSIFEYEISTPSGLLRPGDRWESARNPGYFSPSALRLMHLAFPEKGWEALLEPNFELLEKSGNASTGLIPDWCDENGDKVPNFGYTFGVEAVRYPWRMGLYHYWFGHLDNRGTLYANRIAEWVATVTGGDPRQVGTDYSLAGAPARSGPDGGRLYIGGFCTATGASENQAFMDACYSYVEDSWAGAYYQGSVQMLNLITMSGLLQNYWQ